MCIKPVAFVVILALSSLCSLAGEEPDFQSPQAAVDALVAAVKDGSTEKIVAVLGPEGERLASSGDDVADAAARQRFLTAYDEAHEAKESDGRTILIIGKDEYPFPIPIVANGGAWRFDTAAGEEEILDRRIGQNELSAIQVLKVYVDAQREYAEADRDGKGVQYAQKLLSSEGRQDGLYWPTSEGAPESPLGPLIAEARAEGYRKDADKPRPYHGYLFRILTAQGKNAADGERDYVVNGRMLGGFGLVAVPAEYGNSGVKTFVVNQDGIIFEEDIGDDTGDRAAAIVSFDPDGSWTKVESE